MKKALFEARSEIRGTMQNFSCNTLDECIMPNATKPVNVGEIEAEEVEHLVKLAVGGYTSIKWLIDTKKTDNGKLEEDYNAELKKRLDRINHYTDLRNELLTYQLCKEFVRTKLCTGGIQSVKVDLDALTLTNKDLYTLWVAKIERGYHDALDKLIRECGYSFDCTVSRLVDSLNSNNYSTAWLMKHYKDADKLLKLLLYIFDDMIADDVENKVKELVYILYYKLNSNIVLQVKKHTCNVFDLRQITVKDTRSNKKVNHFINEGTNKIPKNTEVELLLTLTLPDIDSFDEDFNLKENVEYTEKSAEYCMYIPIVIVKSMDMLEYGALVAKGEYI